MLALLYLQTSVLRYRVYHLRVPVPETGPVAPHAIAVHPLPTEERSGQRSDADSSLATTWCAIPQRPPAVPSDVVAICSSKEAISSGSPGAGKPHAGKYGEPTPWRQRGGRGPPLPYPLRERLKVQPAGKLNASSPRPRGPFESRGASVIIKVFVPRPGQPGGGLSA